MPQTVWLQAFPWPLSDQNTAITDTMAEPAFIRKYNRSLLHPPMSSGLTPLASQTEMAWGQWNTRYRWCKRFSVGRESTEADQRPGRLVTVSGVEIVTKINQIVRADRRMSIRMIVEAVNADKETVR
ncbi:uncharacterized protein TNCV_1723501 [Trichonephila clavipes]|nr:uncharacterized protein TNCV_1723501 [Trichonephila clavipes]